MFQTITLAVLDVVIVTFLFYKIIMVFHNTRAASILKGVGFILLLWLISGLVGLETLKFVISQVSLYGILALIILFQPELRSGLEKLGRRNLNYKTYFSSESDAKEVIEDIIQATTHLSKRKIGALICIEMEDSLNEYIQTGIDMNAKISKELLINTFIPNVPLHDGAVIIRGGRIEAASCFLPLSDDDTISKELGTRHRAGLGLSEISDALTVVVSEETGSISIAKDNTLHRAVSIEKLRKYLEEALIQKKDKNKPLLKGRGGSK